MEWRHGHSAQEAREPQAGGGSHQRTRLRFAARILTRATAALGPVADIDRRYAAEFSGSEACQMKK